MSERIRSELLLNQGEKVMRFKRLYSIRRSPLTLIYIYMPIEFQDLAKPLRKEIPRTETTYTLFERAGISLKEARLMISSRAADLDTAKCLEIKVGTPILTVERTIFSLSDKPLEYIVSNYRADKFSYSARLQRQPQGDSKLSGNIINNMMR